MTAVWTHKSDGVTCVLLFGQTVFQNGFDNTTDLSMKAWSVNKPLDHVFLVLWINCFLSLSIAHFLFSQSQCLALHRLWNMVIVVNYHVFWAKLSGILACWKLQLPTTSHSSGLIWFISTETALGAHRANMNWKWHSNNWTDVGQLAV